MYHSILSRATSFGIHNMSNSICLRVLDGYVHDNVPSRAPLVVMDHVAQIAAYRTFAEIGSRHGDVIECVSHWTRGTAVSIEGDPVYCPALATRAGASGNRWTSVCDIFSSEMRPVPQAELFYTWVQHYLVVALLNAMHKLHRRALVPDDVEFAMGFSGPEHPAEFKCWRQLSKFANRSTHLYYNEAKKHRGAGRPIVGVFRIRDLNITELELAARSVCHKGNVLQDSSNNTFFSDSGDARLHG